MRMLCTIAGLAFCCSMGGAAFAAENGAMKLSAAQCSTLWEKVNTSGAATIDASQAQGYVTNFKAADPDNDGTLSKTEFQAACAKGLVKIWLAAAPPPARKARIWISQCRRPRKLRPSCLRRRSSTETSSVRCERLGRPLRAAQVRWRLDHSAASTTGSCSLRTTGCPSIPDASRAPTGRVLRDGQIA